MSRVPLMDLPRHYREVQTTILDEITKVVESGSFINGPAVSELEDRLSMYVGVEGCLGVSSGTDALLIALRCLDIGPGDEVVTTPFTFVSTVETIVLTGAIPVFADVESATGNISVNSVKRCLTDRTKAIVAVSLFGQPCELLALRELADDANVYLIEDAAQSFGASHHGKKSCSIAHISCTSFFPTKPLGCFGDGGAIFSNDEGLIEKARMLREHGQSRKYHYDLIGYCARLDTIQAAILLVKMKSFDTQISERQRVGRIYDKVFLDEGLEVVRQKDANKGVYAQYSIVTSDRKNLRVALEASGIGTAIYYPFLLSEFPEYSKYGDPAETPVAWKLSREILALPMYPWLDSSAQDFVISSVLENASRRS